MRSSNECTFVVGRWKISTSSSQRPFPFGVSLAISKYPEGFDKFGRSHKLVHCYAETLLVYRCHVACYVDAHGFSLKHIFSGICHMKCT